MKPNKYEYIDSLRGVAVLMVVFVHVILSSSEIWKYYPELLQVSMQRWIHCIQLFFIVSAFTLTISYQNRLTEKHATRNFIIRRFFRIAPMYYLAVIYFTFAVFIGFDFSNLDFSKFEPKGFISSVLFLNGLFPAWINSYVPGGWTITVECMFYFFMPFICKYINNLNRSLLFVLVTLLLSTLVNSLLAGTSFDKFDFLYYYFPNQLPVFALGILTYWLIKEDLSNIKPLYGLFAVIVLMFYCYISIPAHILDTIVFVLLILVLNKHPFRALSNKILSSIGECSFSMYLIHFAILNIMVDRMNIRNIISVTNGATAIIDILLFYLVVGGGAYLIARLTYKFIEVPGQSLGRKLIKRLG